MGCRGAIHCAHLGSRGIPQGAMNCAPTPCAYLKGIDRKGQPYSTRACQADSPYSRGDPLRSPWPFKFTSMGASLALLGHRNEIDRALSQPPAVHPI